MNLKIIQITLLVALLLSGCMQPTPPKIPSWMDRPPEDNSTVLYRSAIGKTEDEAMQNALKLIGTSIYLDAKRSIERTYSSDDVPMVLQNAQFISRSLEFSDTKLIRFDEQDEQHIVLVSTDRVALFDTQEELLKSDMKSIEERLEESKSEPNFVQLSVLHRVSKELRRVYARLHILKSIKGSYDSKRVTKRLKEIRRQYNSLKFSLKVRVVSDATAMSFIKPLQNALIAEGLVVATTDPTPAPVVILLSADSKQSSVDAHFFESIWLRISIKEHKDEIATSEHEYSGKSSLSYKRARQLASEKFKKELLHNGLFETLGLD